MASVNAKGSILSDFHIINRTTTTINQHILSSIENFQCLSDDFNQLFSIQWSIDYESRLHIQKYILYYIDTMETNNDLIRQLSIPLASLTMTKQQSHEVYKYDFNSSLFDLNYNTNHKLRLQLAIIDQNDNHMPITDSSIYCSLTKKSSKSKKKEYTYANSHFSAKVNLLYISSRLFIRP